MVWFVKAYYGGWIVEKLFSTKESADDWAQIQRERGANVFVREA